jgi:hypothetical protein
VPRVRAENRLSLWSAYLSWGSLSLATDSAIQTHIDGAFTTTSSQKIWRLGHSSLWVAAAGCLRGIAAPPAVWPDPTPAGGPAPHTFEDWARALHAQMAGGRYTTSPLYSLALIDPSDHDLKLAKISNGGGLEFGSANTVFLGGYADRSWLPAWDFIPADLAECRDLVIAFASRTLRIDGHERSPSGGPAIAWPVFLYQWHGEGIMTSETIIEDEGRHAQRRNLARHAADVVQTSLIQSPARFYDQLLSVLESNDLLDEDIAEVKIHPIQPIKATIIRSSANSPPVALAAEPIELSEEALLAATHPPSHSGPQADPPEAPPATAPAASTSKSARVGGQEGHSRPARGKKLTPG